MKILFGTVFYPKVFNILPSFINSLESQSDPDFHLLIINDNCNTDDIDFGDLQYTIISGRHSVNDNREILIYEIIRSDYEWVIFGDSDDYFDANRVEVIKEFTQNYDLIANEIIPFDDYRQYSPKFQKVLGDFGEINSVFIRDKNLFGFSNVACRTSFLKNKPIPNEIIAVDWYVFAKALQAGAKACFTSKTNTFYRQWEHNIIGINKEGSKHIKTGVKAKYFHYKNMISCDPWYGGELPWLKNLYYHSDSKFFNLYYNKLEQQREDYCFWWENIKNYQL